MIYVLMWLFGCTEPEKSDDSAELDFDTADPYDRTDACDLSTLEVLGSGSTVDLGDFTVVPTNSGLLIETAQKVVFKGMESWLTVSLVDRDVDEYQGSFSVDYATQLDCITPKIKSISSSDSAMLLEGEFLDEGCDDKVFSMQVCLSSEDRLFFDIAISAPEIEHTEEYRVSLYHF